VAASRLFDEMIKLLLTGHALRSVEALKAQGLDRGLFPVLDAALGGDAPDPRRTAFVTRALEDTDRRVDEGRSVVPSFMLACMLWHDVVERWEALKDAGEPPFPALQQAIDAVFDARIGDISGRGKLAADMREIWLMQPRFERRAANSARALIAQPRFRAGYDFLRLRADVGEVAPELADWWEDFHLGDDDEREALLQDAKSRQAPQRRRVTAAEAAGERTGDKAASGPAEDDSQPPSGEAGDAPARRKRRRRRRPAGAAAVDARPAEAEPTAE
jgi:poly(A) polymerase